MNKKIRVCPCTNKQEAEANYFALSLLMPKDLFKAVWGLFAGELESVLLADQATARYFGVGRVHVQIRRKYL